MAEHFEVQPTLVVMSAYRRSEETSQSVLERYPTSPSAVWPVQEFTFLDPEAYRGTTRAERESSAEFYWRRCDPNHRESRRAESFADFMKRVHDVADRLRSLGCGPVVVFSHRKFIAALMWRLITGDRKVSSRRMERFRAFDRAVAIKNGTMVPLRLSVDGDWIGRAKGIDN